MSDIKKIKTRIRALLSKTTENGCTEEEALLASSKAQELLSRFDLARDDLSKDAFVEVSREGMRKRTRADMLLGIVAGFCGCKLWIRKPDWTRHLFGREQDVEIAWYLNSLIWSAVQSAVARFKASEEYLEWQGRSNRLQSIKAFEIGMLARISERLDEMKAERIRSQAGENRSPDSLVVQHTASLEKAFSKLGLMVRSAKPIKGIYSSHRGDLAAGKEAGDKVSLNEGVRSENSPAQALLPR
ncbi:DUF2786 domain-containing protein [Kiloniella sp.]|uniref:DUF2786 domain-containing protein n=1 Tax=Kiloniella sp. TaxID=1938587 RepID=UPI003B022CA9